MEFDLTNELIKQITFAMENQTELFVFDSEEKVLKKKEDISKSFDSDEKSGSFQRESQVDNRYFSLPEWNSVLGFKMMEKFVSVLNNPLARSDLKQVLSLQKGSFRNFKILYLHIQKLKNFGILLKMGK